LGAPLISEIKMLMYFERFVVLPLRLAYAVAWIAVQTFNLMAELPETRLNPETTHNTTNNNYSIRD